MSYVPSPCQPKRAGTQNSCQAGAFTLEIFFCHFLPRSTVEDPEAKTQRNLSGDNWGHCWGTRLWPLPSKTSHCPVPLGVSFKAIVSGPGGTSRLAGSSGTGRSSKMSPCTLRADRSCASWGAQVSVGRSFLNSPSAHRKACDLM